MRAERFLADTSSANRICYGGSVKTLNTSEILSSPEFDGVGVGSARLDV